MIILSAPAKAGYRAEFFKIDAARREAAKILGIDPGDMIEVESPDGATTYCYDSQEAADVDAEGAYAVQYSGEEVGG